jgi:hypothetical protein
MSKWRWLAKLVILDVAGSGISTTLTEDKRTYDLSKNTLEEYLKDC